MVVEPHLYKSVNMDLAHRAATMEPPSFKLRGILNLCHDRDDDEACTVACRIKDSE